MLDQIILEQKTRHEIRSLLDYSITALDEIEQKINAYHRRIQVLNSCLEHFEDKLQIMARFIDHQAQIGGEYALRQARSLTNPTKAQIQRDIYQIEEELNRMTDSLNILDFIHEEITEHLLKEKS